MADFIEEKPDLPYRLIIGSDSHLRGKNGESHLKLVTAIIVHRVGLGGRYFWQAQHLQETKTLRDKIYAETKNAAYEIIAKKGATYYAIALSLVAIVEAILRDENGVLPVSTLIHDYHEIEEVYLSMPSIVNRHGVRQFLKLALSSDEALQLKNSAKKLKEILKAIGF